MGLCLVRRRGREKIVDELEKEQRGGWGIGGGRDDREENKWTE